MKTKLSIFAALLLAASLPATASEFRLQGSYWDTDAVGDAAGGGIGFNFSFNDVLGLDLRATYFEELSNESIFLHSDAQVFQEAGINVLPLEVGLRFTFVPGGSFRPYGVAGAGYYLLDSDFGELKDEVGFWGGIGASFGDDVGPAFFVEATYRKLEGTVELDPEDLADLGDLEIEDHADVDLDGFGANLGIAWRF